MPFVTPAFAQAAAGAAGATPSFLDPTGPFGNIAMIAALVLIFWFLIFRPQQKRAREQKAMLSAISRGDTVVTSGIIGKVTKAVEGEDLEVEIAQGVKVKVLRSAVSDVRSKGQPVNENKAA